MIAYTRNLVVYHCSCFTAQRHGSTAFLETNLSSVAWRAISKQFPFRLKTRRSCCWQTLRRACIMAIFESILRSKSNWNIQKRCIFLSRVAITKPNQETRTLTPWCRGSISQLKLMKKGTSKFFQHSAIHLAGMHDLLFHSSQSKIKGLMTSFPVYTSISNAICVLTACRLYFFYLSVVALIDMSNRAR